MAVVAQTTAFTYQGSLKDNGSPANGSYQMQFKLFDAAMGGVQIGSTINDVPITASAGIFNARLDFGATALSGGNRWLEIGIRRVVTEPYTTLSPREQLASAPYAVRTLSAATADVATNAITAATATNSLNLGGQPANQYVQTNDPRLSDPRNPLPGSGNYIQNTSTLQSSSNFNISGTGTVGALTTNGPVTVGGVSPPPSAPTGQGRVYFDTGTNKFRISENGGAFVDLVGSSGVSGSGSVNSVPLWSAGTTLANSAIAQFGGNIGIGTATPAHRFALGSGPPWTGDAWTGSVELPNTGAIGWRPNTSSQSFGIGQTNWGLSFFRTSAPLGGGFPGAAPTYAMNIDNSGNVGIGITAPTARLDVSGPIRAFSASLVNIGVETTGTSSGALFSMTAPGRAWVMGTSTSSGNAFQLIDGLFDPRMTILPNSGPISFPVGTFSVGGNATQARDKGGWAKAMIQIDNGSIVNCYNSQVSGTAANTVPCNFQVQPGLFGSYIINFGFQVNDRFILGTPFTLGGPAQFVNPWHNPTAHTPNQIEVVVHDHTGNSSTNRKFFIFVF